MCMYGCLFWHCTIRNQRVLFPSNAETSINNEYIKQSVFFFLLLLIDMCIYNQYTYDYRGESNLVHTHSHATSKKEKISNNNTIMWVQNHKIRYIATGRCFTSHASGATPIDLACPFLMSPITYCQLEENVKVVKNNSISNCTKSHEIFGEGETDENYPNIKGVYNYIVWGPQDRWSI